MCKLLLSYDQNSYLMEAVICDSSYQANFRRWLIMSLYWYACISINTYCYVIYHISLEIVWWALSNASLIMQIHLVIHEILVNRDFTVTNDLISWLFVITFVHPTYIQIALIWSFTVQLSLWKLVHWLWDTSWMKFVIGMREWRILFGWTYWWKVRFSYSCCD